MAVVHRISEIFRVIHVTASIMETFGGVKAYLQKKGVSIADMDLVIGSTALTLNYHLVTNNEKHFQKIPGLKIENWTVQ